MTKFKNFFLFLIFLLSFNSISVAEDKYFNEGLKLFNEEKYEDAKFLFERSIVFDPKASESYLYLAKIYEVEKNSKKEEKNIETTLLLDPTNEEALLMSMRIALEKTNYSKVKSLSETFSRVCKKLCNEKNEIIETLNNLEPKNES
jgi:tetratricopeptide (TPR) repeat protein